MTTQALGSAIRSGTKWLLAGNIGSQVLQFLVGIIMARLLVPADFGMIVTIQIFTGFAGFFATGGLGQALVQRKEISTHDYQVIFTSQLFICTLIYAVFYFIAPQFAYWFDNPLYTDLLRLSAVSFLLRPFRNVPSSLLQRDMKFKLITTTNLLTLVVSAATGISLAYNGFGAWSLIISGLLGSLAAISLLFFFTRWRIRLRFSLSVLKKFSDYGVKVTGVNLLSYATREVPNFVITKMLGVHEVGLYNKASSLNSKPMDMIGTAPYKAIFRALASAQDDENTSRYIYVRAVALITLYTAPFYSILWWTAEPLINFLYGNRWTGAAGILQILAIAGIFRCISNPSGAVLQARKLVGVEFIIRAGGLLLLIPLCYLGVKEGDRGVAFAVITAFAVTAIAITLAANRSLSITPLQLIKPLLRPFTYNILLFGSLAASHQVLSRTAIISYDGAYVASMCIIGSVTYAGLFLMFPGKLLTGEAERWKTKILRSRSVHE